MRSTKDLEVTEQLPPPRVLLDFHQGIADHFTLESIPAVIVPAPFYRRVGFRGGQPPRTPFNKNAYNRLGELAIKGVGHLEQLFVIPDAGRFKSAPPGEIESDLQHPSRSLTDKLRGWLQQRKDVSTFRKNLPDDPEVNEHIYPYGARMRTREGMAKYCDAGGKFTVVTATYGDNSEEMIDWLQAHGLSYYLDPEFPLLLRVKQLPDGLWVKDEPNVGSIGIKPAAALYFDLIDGVSPHGFDNALEVQEIWSRLYGIDSDNPELKWVGENMRQQPFPKELVPFANKLERPGEMRFGSDVLRMVNSLLNDRTKNLERRKLVLA